MEAASRLDPLASVYVRQIAFVRFCAGNYAGALAEFRHAVELEPGSRTARREAVTTLATMGRFDEAIDAWRRDSLNDMPNELRALLARARGEEGYRAARRTQASLVLDQVRSRSKDRYAPPTSLAHAHAILGQWDSTLVWLERAADDRDPAVLKVSCEREYDPIRSHPRFQTLLRRLGLGA